MRKSNYLWLLLVAVLLLPAQEMAAKKKKEKEVTDRELWAGVLYQMAAPVLSNMSEGKLQENMQVELSPTWDGRDKRVTYMECFGRLMAGLAPWLSLPDDDTAEGKQRRQLREWALKSYAQAVDGSPAPKEMLRLFVDEAFRVINGMPKWTPGQKDGKAVAVRYVLPFTFRLQ